MKSLGLQCRTLEIEFRSCEIKKDNYRDSRGKEIRAKTKNLLNSLNSEANAILRCSYCCRRGFVNLLIFSMLPINLIIVVVVVYLF